MPIITHASEGGRFGNSPRLPEPLVFDLVLPLGANKHEYEFNALSQYNLERDAVEFNPEFEYAYADGFGIELELPTQNDVVTAYKLGLQGTFNFLRTSQFIHGWQYIGEYHKQTEVFENERAEFENDLLYLFGYQFDTHWSTLNMTGFRLTDPGSHGRVEGLINANLYYSFLKNFRMGLEMNWESRPHRPDITSVMPQLHVGFAQHAKMQFGFGMKRTEHQNFPHAALRIIFRF